MFTLTKAHPYLPAISAHRRVDLVVVAVDPDDPGTVDQRVEHLALLQIGGDEHVGVEAGRGRVGRHRVGQVPGGGAGDGPEAQLAGAAQGHADHPVLEGERGVVDRVVLDPQLADSQPPGEAIGPDQRGVAHLDAHGRLRGHRKQLPVAPHVLGTGGDALTAEGLPDPLVVVGHLQGPEVELADMPGLQGVVRPALPAPERLHVPALLVHRCCSSPGTAGESKTALPGKT